MTAPSTDLALPAEILNPVNGQLVPTNDIQAVAQALRILDDAAREVRNAKAAFSDAAAAESRRQGTRTLNFPEGRYQIVVSADTELEWDIERLQRGLADAGCPEERINDLVGVTVTHTVNQSVARQLSSSNPVYKAAIEAAQSRKPKRQYASVKPL